MSKENSGFEGVWIPKNLYFNKDLSWSEKILLMEIDSLDRDKLKGCYAGNKHLADHLGLKPSTVANMISKLKQSGWITELWTDGRNRGLRVDFSPIDKPENGKPPSQKNEAASQKYEGSSQNYDNASQKNEDSTENDTDFPQKQDELSQNNDDFSPEPSQKYEGSPPKVDSEPSQKSEHSNNKGFSTNQLVITHSTATAAGNGVPEKPPPKVTAAVCVDCKNPKKTKRQKSDRKRPRSEFSLADCLRYAEKCRKRGENILNPKGLATKLYRSGEADAFIKATLYPERAAEDFPDPVEFTNEPCSVCFGAKMEIVEGLGARPCLHCWNERDQPTGREPKGDP